MKNKKFEDYLLKVISKYKKILKIERHNIDVEFDDMKDAYMKINFSYPYLDTTVRYSKDALEDFNNKKFQDNVVLHELCHVITDPLYGLAYERFVGKRELEDMRELTTDIICNIIDDLTKKKA